MGLVSRMEGGIKAGMEHSERREIRLTFGKQLVPIFFKFPDLSVTTPPPSFQMQRFSPQSHSGSLCQPHRPSVRQEVPPRHGTLHR